MPMKTDKKRALESAKTQKKILKAAISLFIKKGFEGTSISEIAKKAEINQSLIYHYHESKEALWKNVKKSIIDIYIDIKDLDLDVSKGLRHVLEKIVYTRFDFYEKHPEVLRMMAWQKLESKKDQLTGGTLFSPDNWKKVFMQLKKQGEIRKDVDLDMMILFITSVINGALNEDHQDRLKIPKDREDYLKMIVESFLRSFGTS